MSTRVTGPRPYPAAGLEPRIGLPVWSIVPLVASGLGIGLGVAVLGERYGPWAPVALVVVPLVVLVGMARPVWAMGLVLAAMPVGALELWVGGYSIAVIQLVALAAVALTAASRLLAARTPLSWPGRIWWAAGLVGIAVLGTPSAVDPDAAVKQDLQVVVGLLVALGIVSAVRDAAGVRWLTGVILLVGGGMCAYALTSGEQLRASFGGAVVGNRAHGLFTEPNQLGIFSAIVLLLGCGALLGARTAPLRAGAGIVVAVALAALGLSLSRGAWLGASLGLVGFVVLLPVAGRRLLLLLLVAAIGLTAILAHRPDNRDLAIVGDRLRTLSSPTGNPDDARPAIYREAVREIIQRPITGFGPAGFPAASARSGSEVQSYGALHAHNALLTVAAEVGLPAAATLVGFTLAIGVAILRTVRRLRRRGRTREAAQVAALGAALLAVVGQGIVDYTLRHAVIAVLVWALVGLALAAERVTMDEPESDEAEGPAWP